MYFAIHTLRIIIFATFISNILTKPENSIRFDKHDDTKENIHNIKLRNNTYITQQKIYKIFNIEIPELSIVIILLMVGIVAYFSYILYYGLRNEGIQWRDCKRLCDRRFIRRNCLLFSECCRVYMRNFPKGSPAPEPIIRYQPEAADYRDIYEMPDSPV